MTASTTITDERRGAARNRLYEILGVLGAYVLVAVLFGLGCLISGEFLTPQNLMNTLQAVTLLGIVSIGVAFITYSQHYVDLSIPGIMALAGIVAVSTLEYGIVASLAWGLAAGVVVGLINGLVIGYLRLNPIIWTLAMMSVLSGVIRKVYAGKQIYPDSATAAGKAFLDLYHTQIGGLVPLPVALLIVLAIVALALMWKTCFGAQLKLAGSSYEVARMTGVNVRRTVATAFVISAATSAIAGILLTSFNKVGAQYIGKGYDFAAITAVVIGGMTLAGGRGNIIGVLGGVMVIALMNNVMSLVRIGDFTISEFHKAIIQGVVFILVVGISSYSRRKSGLDDA
ncbi:MAG: ABC transporter permease [Planctomycetota bacterium]|nr:ABC transporter permease [Planctomycetota bacterium]